VLNSSFSENCQARSPNFDIPSIQDTISSMVMIQIDTLVPGKGVEE
jgi:hypothetical protein